MRMACLLGLVAMTLASGCSSKLETGYVPRKLGVSDNVRRAYYATPYTAESNAATQDREAELDARRPNKY